ncbi:MerR family transcriptional regulator [Sanguibacter inulinus]|uniref:MerR family transcriptional regulator n=2 Tax=Sanguibacter inulinus TaxID=60922 RepID=A0A853EZT4_9MICO|nr:MerR family transcriptional regulator [Sanguibacter inulinus]NYS95092.1 MerR family transcriptional regulator [Sanguibacter inulinus]
MTAPEAHDAAHEQGSARTATPTPTPTMHIGALAERTGMSLRTLRHYDETGLLKPSGRSEGGFRLYTDDDLARLLVIRRMKPLGFSLDEMADLLEVVDQLRASAGSTGSADGADSASSGYNAADTHGSLRARLDAYVESAQERRAELARKLDMADEFIALLRST